MLPDARLLQFLICSTAVDALVAGAILFWPAARGDATPRRMTLRRMLGAVSGAACIFALKLPLFRMQGLSIFGLVNLVYVDLVVLLPGLAIAILLWAARRRTGPHPLTRPAMVAACLTLLAIPVGVFATFIEPFRLQSETADIPLSSTRSGASAVRVAVLADIQINHVTDYERAAVNRLMGMKPDIILIPGDVFQASFAQFEREEPALRELFRRLDAPGGVFMALGDVDWNTEVIHRIFEGSHVRVLVNEITRVQLGDRSIVVGGVELNYASEAADRLVRELEDTPGDGDIRILLAHRPDAALSLKDHSRIDLVVAGHTHGGQVVVPFYGPPMTLSQIPRKIAAGGLHRIHENPIYVSRGVGCERGQAPRIRFLCPPEISLLTLGPTARNR